jgi:hypothetical protein
MPRHRVTEVGLSWGKRRPEASQADRGHERVRASAPADRFRRYEQTHNNSARRLLPTEDARPPSEVRPLRKAGAGPAPRADNRNDRKRASPVSTTGMPKGARRPKGTAESSRTSLGPLEFELAVWQRSLKRLKQRRASKQAADSDFDGGSSPDSRKDPEEFASVLSSKLEAVQKKERRDAHPMWCMLCILVTWTLIWASKQQVSQFLLEIQ